jgi:hypothetical protein
MSESQSSDQIDSNKEDFNQLAIGLSWVAYTKLVPIAILSLILVYITTLVISDDPLKSKIFYFVLVALIIWNVYSIALIQSKKLIVNSQGVWFVSGIIPWKKTSMGLQWRNIGVVSYANNLSTYLTKSYTVFIHDRYTENVAVSIKDIENGDLIISTINDILSKKNQT